MCGGGGGVMCVFVRARCVCAIVCDTRYYDYIVRRITDIRQQFPLLMLLLFNYMYSIPLQQ